MFTDESATVVELPRDLHGDVVRKAANNGMMVAFINADRLNRAHLDVRKSIVLYDEGGLFECATGELPGADVLRKLYAQTNIRYWSKGIV